MKTRRGDEGRWVRRGRSDRENDQERIQYVQRKVRPGNRTERKDTDLWDRNLIGGLIEGVKRV